MKIYRECTEDLYSFLRIDTMLSASNPLRFRKKKIFFFLIKMTVTDQIIVLDIKIKQNETVGFR